MELGKRLFRFAVIADTHVNQEEGKASSDFAVNRLANARNRHVVQALNRAKPSLVLHVGDIVHPSPQHPAYGQAAERFHELMQPLECPLHLAPGNHDIGDKPGDWLPVPSVNEAFLALYRKHFGRNFSSFDAQDCHFVLIDAQIIGSGLASEAEQRDWLERDLEDNRGRRIFLGLHYPPFLHEPDEPDNYDNLDGPGRAWLLGLFRQHRVEAVFAGHVHNFWYHVLGDTRFYLMPSTAFVRFDYAEMYRIEPGPERGRNDAPKLGFLLVDVHEHGHVAYPVRSDGRMLAPGEQPAAAEELAPVHPLTISRSPVGIDLRHPWAETVEIPPSGALEEFSRKTVRNDWPVMALLEMGIRNVRVPLVDLGDARLLERMRVLAGCGIRFTVYSHAVPDPALCEALVQSAGLIEAWEVIASLAQVDDIAAKVARIRAAQPFQVRFSKLRRPGDPVHHGQKARHVIEHGFDVSEEGLLEELLARPAIRAAFDGVLYRVPRQRGPAGEMEKVMHRGSRLATRDFVMVRFASDNPGEMPEDALDDANRAAETLFAAHGMPQVGAWIDTFNDVDRGYFPRTGLVDRRYNPRPAGKVCRGLNSVLGRGATTASFAAGVAGFEGGRVLELAQGPERLSLILPERPIGLSSIPATQPPPGDGLGRWIDLASGTIAQVRWRASAQGYRLDSPVRCDAPSLFCVPAGGS
jgi:3',5'-cyclic AMP phosphodiesterase CpdA